MGVEASRPPVPRELNPGSVRIVTRDDTNATHIDIGSINSIADEETETLEVSPNIVLVDVFTKHVIRNTHANIIL